MWDIRKIFKQAGTFKKQEISLCIVVFIWLFSLSILFNFQDPEQVTRWAAAALLFSLFIENYITSCVYYGINESIRNRLLTWKEILRNGLFFFGRMLLFKALFGLLALILISTALAVPTLLEKCSLAATAVMFPLLLCWIALPFFFLSLTLMSPFIIIAGKCDVGEAILKSMRFTRKNLGKIIVLILPLALIWGVAFFINRVYNFTSASGTFQNIVKSVSLSIAEVFTIKVLFIFYHLKSSQSQRRNSEEEHERNI